LRAAGLGAVALAGGSALFVADRAFARQSAETRVGERRRLMLDDGSVVELNTDSRLAWRLGDRGRDAWLERGEAALEVAPAGAPFTLHAGSVDARLEPGRYNARRRGPAVELLVFDGALAAEAASGRTVRAGDGSRAVLAPTAAAVRPASPSEQAQTSAWRQDEIVFDGDPLAAAVEEYNRYLDRKLVVPDPTVARLRLGGRFRSTDPRGFLAALEAAFGVRAVERGDRVLLVAENQAPE